MYIDDYLPINEGFEGRSATMYQDPKGNVTVACGLELATAQAASVLPFLDADGNPASTARIVADWHMVAAFKPGYKASYYAFPGASHLADASIDELQRSKILQFDADLRARFPRYDSYPDGVKMALLDMEYNLGDARERSEYVHFDAAVTAGDWLRAAGQCGRDSSDPAFAARNAWTKLQFMNALGGEAAA